MSKKWTLAGELTTASSSNPKRFLTVSPLDQTAIFTEQSVQSGYLDTSPSNDWYSVPMGPVSVTGLVELRIDIPISVRINGSLVIPSCMRYICDGQITSLELQRQISTSPFYWAQFFD